jgi:penicillin-binding protein 1A
MGITTHLDGIPAETLGGLRLGVSPLEMADAYGTLASYGMHNEPIAIKKVVFPDGHVDETGKPDRNRVFQDGVAYEVTKILEDNVDAGTGTAAQTDCSYEAGKTGTTDDFNDAMFVGYTPQLTTAVWVGYPNELRSMSSVHGIAVAGGTFPAEIWHDYMEVALHRPEINHGEFCPAFPEPRDSVEWIPFHGTYSSDSGGSSCSYGGVTGSGSSEGSYSCGSSSSYSPSYGGSDNGSDSNQGAYAPGVDQKPAPSPKPKPTPTPPAAPPAAPPPSGGVNPG